MSAEAGEQVTSRDVATRSPRPIEDDVPCAGCSYDLRGLTPSGRCPECGRDVAGSLAAWARRRRPLPPPNPAWVARVRSGAWLSVFAFAMLLFAGACVRGNVEWYRLPYRNAPVGETPARVLLLALVCVGWVAAWASAWRLTTPERPNEAGRAAAFIAAAARWTSSTYLVLPFVWALATWHTQYVAGVWGYAFTVLGLASLAAGFLLPLRVGLVARRLRPRRGWIPAAEGGVLALLVPAACMLAAASQRYSGATSLYTMFNLPAFPYGSAAHVQFVVRSPGDLDEPFVWCMLIVPLWSLSLVIRVIAWSRPQVTR